MNAKKLPGGPLVSSSGAASKSQLFPIFSSGSALKQKAYLVPAVVTVIFVVAMFATLGTPLYNLLLGAYLAGAAYYFVYLLCGKHKPWWLLLGAAMTTMLILASPLFSAFVLVFREILPGAINQNQPASFVELFIGMFFGAGLMEELLKALPVLGAYWLGSRLRTPWRERVGVWEPLDGILIGTASAVGFTLLETLGEYVPGTIQRVGSEYGAGAGHWVGLQLLIPRIMGSLTGHMAYSGYLGYFIGLAILKPATRWQVLAIGYLSAAGLHALWNSSAALGNWALVVVGCLSYAFLSAAILKARQISPTRSENFATQVIGASTPVFPAKFSLLVGGRSIVLYAGTKVREQDIPGIRARSADGIVGEVTRHPQDTTILGLKNLSHGTWMVTVADSSTRQVRPGQSVKLAARTKIHFGSAFGEIRS
jgi:RsiW-degrading membrane proteinase PrsW (M82 family)